MFELAPCRTDKLLGAHRPEAEEAKQPFGVQVETEEADYTAAAVLACTVLVLQVVILVLGALSLKSVNSTLQHIQQNGEGVSWHGSLFHGSLFGWNQAVSQATEPQAAIAAQASICLKEQQHVPTQDRPLTAPFCRCIWRPGASICKLAGHVRPQTAAGEQLWCHPKK